MKFHGKPMSAMAYVEFRIETRELLKENFRKLEVGLCVNQNKSESVVFNTNPTTTKKTA